YRRGRKVTGVEQRAAGQITQQPNVSGLVQQSRYHRAFFTRQVGQRRSDPQRRFRLGDPDCRGVLGFQLRRVESRIGDLEHAEDVSVGVVDDEVAILVAAKQFGARRHAVVLREDLLSLRFGDLMAGQLRLFEEVEADSAAWGAHRLTNWTTTSLN